LKSRFSFVCSNGDFSQVLILFARPERFERPTLRFAV
jgi:hypothetical protein